MKEKKEYLLPFSGLKIGIHYFDFQVDGTFFEGFPEAEIYGGNVHINVALDKQEQMMIFDFDIEGNLMVTCDRCLETFPFPIHTQETLIVKFGEEYEEVSDDLITIPSFEHTIDLQQHIYEYIMLALPMQRIHPDLPDRTSGCNQEMLQHLGQVEKEEDGIDPRWEALSRLKNK